MFESIEERTLPPLERRIRYREGYNYQLVDDYRTVIEIRPVGFILTDYVRLDTDGTLWICKGYAWDGPSGPAIDTKNFMRGSLVHDALYQLMRGARLPQSARLEADKILRRICLEDGMSSVRAWWVYTGVRVGAAPAAAPGSDAPDLEAP